MSGWLDLIPITDADIARIASLEATLEAHDTAIDAVETIVSDASDALDTANGELATAQSDLADAIEVLDGLVADVDALSTAVTNLTPDAGSYGYTPLVFGDRDLFQHVNSGISGANTLVLGDGHTSRAASTITLWFPASLGLTSLTPHADFNNPSDVFDNFESGKGYIVIASRYHFASVPATVYVLTGKVVET